MPLSFADPDSNSPRSRRLLRLPVLAGLAACLGLIDAPIVRSPVRGDVQRCARPANPLAQRTWPDVQAETSKVFEGCLQHVEKARDSLPRGTPAITGRISTSLQPDTCSSQFKYQRNIVNGFPETILILDVRLERDYSQELRAASSFRVVPYRVDLEGKTMYQRILAYLRENKWPFEVVDPRLRVAAGNHNRTDSQPTTAGDGGRKE